MKKIRYLLFICVLMISSVFGQTVIENNNWQFNSTVTVNKLISEGNVDVTGNTLENVYEIKGKDGVGGLILNANGPIMAADIIYLNAYSVQGEIDPVLGYTTLRYFNFLECNGAGITNLDSANMRFTSSIIPTTSNAVDLGSSALPFRHGYFGTNSVYLGTNKLSVAGNTLQLNDTGVSAAETDPVFLAYKPTLLSRFATDENNILLNAFRIQALANVSYRDMIGAWVDGYIDQTGINTGACVNAYYGVRNYSGKAIGGASGSFSWYADSGDYVSGFIGSYAVNLDETSTSKGFTNYLPGFTGSESVSLWIKVLGHANLGYVDIVFMRTISDASQGGFRFGVANYEYGSEIGKMQLVDDTGSNYGNSTATVNDGNWHHVVSVYDSSASTLKLYINGNLEVSLSSATYPTTDEFYVFGRANWDYYAGFHCQLDQVGLYSKALSEAEIAAIYNGGSGVASLPTADLEFELTFEGQDLVYQELTATNLTLISTNYLASSIPTEMDVMIIAATNGAPTINTQIVVQVTANNGTNYQAVTLSDAGLFDSTKRFYTGTITNITNPGNRLGYRIETTNAVDVSFYGASIMYR